MQALLTSEPNQGPIKDFFLKRKNKRDQRRRNKNKKPKGVKCKGGTCFFVG